MFGILLKFYKVSIFLLYVTFGGGLDWIGKEVHCRVRHPRARSVAKFIRGLSL